MVSCRNSAIKLLAARDYSVSGLAMKLKIKGYGSECIDQILEELRQKGYINEERYRDSVISRLLKKNYSDGSIRRQLEREGIPVLSIHIEEMRKEINLNSEAQIRQLIGKKASLLSRDKSKGEEKVLRYLISRGHPYEQCRKILTEFQKETF